MMESDESKLFVGGIKRDTTEDTLRDYFVKYGNVVSCVVAKDRLTGGSRGFAFVSFSDQSSVDRALQDSHIILERKVEVKRAIPKSEQHQNGQQQSTVPGRNGRSNDHFRTKKIFVGGLSSSLTEGEFRSYFAKFGTITDVVVMHDNLTRRPRGFGFITFDSEDAVEAVIQRSFHELCGKSVEVKKAVPKEGSNSSSNGNTSRVSGGHGSTSNGYQHGSDPFYAPYVHPLSYGSFSPYGGGVAGYYYGSNPFGGGYPSGGYDVYYGVPPFAPRSPWNGYTYVGIRGSTLPYGNAAAASVYPTYVNGVGVMSAMANGYDGHVGTGVHGNRSEANGSDIEAAADTTHSQINGENTDVNTSELDRSCGAEANKENQRDIHEQSRAYPVGDSS